MELAMKLFLCLFGIQLLLSVSSEGLLFNNTAVVVGSRATLNCSSDITPYWAWRLPNNTLVATSSSGSRCIIDPLYTSSYAVSAPSVGSCNLIILSATSSDAGSYSCSDGGRVTGTPMLLVLDSGPHCSADALNNKVVYPDKVTMNCSVQYDPSNGWIPRLQWNTTDSTSPGTTGNTSYSTYIYNTSASTPIPSYSCSVVYNTSVYVDIPSCSTNPVTVFWCPTAVIISGASDGHITFGNNLTCSASGNPGPTYKWFNSTNNLLSNSSWLTVSKQDNYTCTASNNANGSPCSASNSQFVNAGSTPGANPLGLGLGLGIPCLLLIMGSIM